MGKTKQSTAQKLAELEARLVAVELCHEDPQLAELRKGLIELAGRIDAIEEESFENTIPERLTYLEVWRDNIAEPTLERLGLVRRLVAWLKARKSWQT